MRNAARTVGLVGILVMCVVQLPVHAGQISWTFQRVGENASFQTSDLAMSIGTGQRWPTVFYRTVADELVASSLSPAGWVPTSLDVSLGGLFALGGASAGPDGRVGVAWRRGSTYQFAQSSGPGWPASTVANGIPVGSAGAPDVAYRANSQPVVAYHEQNSGLKFASHHAGGWDVDTLSSSGMYPSVAIGSRGVVAVAFESSFSGRGPIGLAIQDAPDGNWSIEHTVFENAYQPDLAFAPNNIPSLAMFDEITQGKIDFGSFDVQSGSWQRSTLATGVASSEVNLEYNDLGDAGLAYSANDNLIHYRVNSGGGWDDVVLPTGADPVSGVMRTPLPGTTAVLAYDSAGLPVIAYLNTQGQVVLAYDPIVTPEPFSIVLLSFGMLVVIGGRRRRG